MAQPGGKPRATTPRSLRSLGARGLPPGCLDNPLDAPPAVPAPWASGLSTFPQARRRRILFLFPGTRFEARAITAARFDTTRPEATTRPERVARTVQGAGGQAVGSAPTTSPPTRAQPALPAGCPPAPAPTARSTAAREARLRRAWKST